MTERSFHSSLMGMYMMIGGDGQEYGPVTEERLVQWIAEGRANGLTRVRKEDSSEWIPMAELPEFKSSIRQYCPETLSSNEPAASAESSSLGDAVANPAFSIRTCLVRGWNTLVNHAGLLFTVSLLYWILRTTAQIIPYLGGIIGLAVSGALNAGLCVVFLRKLRNQETGLGDLFSGFSLLYLPLTIAFVLTRLFSGIGFICCVLPGIYLWIAWLYTIPLIIDRDCDFWEAMEISRRTITRIWFKVFGLYLIVMAPLLSYMIYAYWRMFLLTNDLIQQSNFMNPFELMEKIQNNPELLDKVSALATGQQLVTVLITPFVMAAVMAGYQMLFPSPEE